MATTIQDVAREAKVSVGTVSRYLNGHKLKKQNMQRFGVSSDTLHRWASFVSCREEVTNFRRSSPSWGSYYQY